jgi:adenylate cyclase class 2
MKGRKSGDRENEIKLPVSGAAAARRLLRAGGFHVAVPRVFETNLIFDTPARGMRQGGTVLRLRQVGRHGIITYKGPADTGGLHKSRQEVEFAVDDPAAAHFILERLGYQPVFRYDKFRTEYARPRESGVATLDETPLGVYLELEGSPRWVDRTASRLGFSPADYVTSTYGRLWAEHCAAHDRLTGDMLFPSRRA